MSWNPSKYLKFLNPRLKPALHLLEESSILLNSRNSNVDVTKVMDLGCGPGNLTKYLVEKYPFAHIDGVDSSQEMIKRAQLDNMDNKNVSFRCNSIEEESLQSSKYDLVYSNAALHWCLDHQILLPRIVSNLVSSDNGGGVFAFQIPDTRDQPSHILMDVAASKCGFTEQLKSIRIPRMDHSADWYYHLLRPHVKSIDLWTTEYTNPLTVQGSINGYDDNKNDDDSNSNNSNNIKKHPVLQFTESTGLQPFVDALNGPSSEQGKLFLQTYNSLLYNAYPVVTVGSESLTLFTFRRFFLVCQK